MHTAYDLYRIGRFIGGWHAPAVAFDLVIEQRFADITLPALFNRIDRT